MVLTEASEVRVVLARGLVDSVKDSPQLITLPKPICTGARDDDLLERLPVRIHPDLRPATLIEEPDDKAVFPVQSTAAFILDGYRMVEPFRVSLRVSIRRRIASIPTVVTLVTGSVMAGSEGKGLSMEEAVTTLPDLLLTIRIAVSFGDSGIGKDIGLATGDKRLGELPWQTH